MMNQKLGWKSVKLTCQTSARPSPRWGHSSCLIGEQLILFGGYADSVYMNDMWIFNTTNMEWKEIKTTGDLPSQRSNCTLNYDVQNNRLLLFGGGGPNKARFNQIYELNWETKVWNKIDFAGLYLSNLEDETAPWERTYHSAQLMYPYLIVFGGEGIADLDDLWIFNVETYKWREVTFDKNTVRPCGRRFHSSCIINNQFFVIAGCHSKYRPLNDVFSIDLTILKQTDSIQGLEWKQKIFNQQGFLTRWGQSIAIQNNNIYIFGGRFSNDLNDLLVLDVQKNKLRVLKVANQNTPKPRRRSCLSLVGNCLLMFGGFNSEYYNDLHYINITENQPKPKKQINEMSIINLINNKQFHDLEIKANNGKIFKCHKGILMKYFKTQHKLNNFINAINMSESQQNLQEFLQVLYRGYGKNKILNKYFIDLPQDSYEKELQFNKYLQSLRKQKNTNSIAQSEKSSFKYSYGIITVSSDEDYNNFIVNNRQNNYRDICFKIGNQAKINANKILLIQNSNYFKNLFSQKFNSDNNLSNSQININIPQQNQIYIQILINCLQNGQIIVPESFNYQSYIELYKLADFLALRQIESIIIYQIYLRIDEKSVNQIFEFANQNNLQDLAVACCRYNLSKNINIQDYQNNKYMKISYQQNKFEIRQNTIIRKQQPKMIKKNLFNCQDCEQDKQNIQNCQ